VCHWVNDIVKGSLRGTRRYIAWQGIVYLCPPLGEMTVIEKIRNLWVEESGQDVAEYAVMLAVILVIVIGTVRLIGSNANNVFSQVGSQLGQ
jgi:Flp pilus assembly pilin Flp